MPPCGLSHTRQLLKGEVRCEAMLKTLAKSAESTSNGCTSSIPTAGTRGTSVRRSATRKARSATKCSLEGWLSQDGHSPRSKQKETDMKRLLIAALLCLSLSGQAEAQEITWQLGKTYNVIGIKIRAVFCRTEEVSREILSTMVTDPALGLEILTFHLQTDGCINSPVPFIPVKILAVYVIGEGEESWDIKLVRVENPANREQFLFLLTSNKVEDTAS